MIKTKIVKGKPNYIYKRKNYVEQPNGTVIHKMKYDELNNTTYVYCRKPSKVIELLSVLIVVCCVASNVLFLHNYKIDVKYNSICIYYDNKLFINLMNDSVVDVSWKVLDNDKTIDSGVLHPNCKVVSIPVESYKQSYEIEFYYNTLITEHKYNVKISVIDKSEYEDK